MFIAYSRFRFRRALRRIKALPKDIRKLAQEGFRRLVIKRWKRLQKVRRFFVGWVSFVGLLIVANIVQINLSRQASLVSVPGVGGIYREAVVGEFDNFNPLYALDGVNAAISKLIFSGLFEYDEAGNLVEDLAESISANKNADSFTVVLKPNLLWQDGRALTAEDVVFTINTILSPDVRSPLLETWKGVEVVAVDARTVTFNLPNSFVPFPHLLQIGILPKHVLADVPPADMRAALFNLQPTGSGPFKLTNFDQAAQIVTLGRNDNFYKGQPLLRGVELLAYQTPDEAKEAYTRGLVEGFGEQAVPLSGQSPEQALMDVSQSRLAAASYVFFNTARPLFKDAELRQGLVQAINMAEVLSPETLVAPPQDSPLLEEQLRLKPSDATRQLPFNEKVARAKLDKQGWKVVSGQTVRQKGKTPLAFNLLVADTAQHKVIGEAIVQSWLKQGVSVNLQVATLDDFQRATVVARDFDAALITTVNGLDPDIFVYWHSSQATAGGLNFSQIKDAELDQALEAGRTRSDLKLRVAKYNSFLARWRELAPAFGVYQDVYVYNLADNVEGYDFKVLVQPADRFNFIEKWSVRTDKRPIE